MQKVSRPSFVGFYIAMGCRSNCCFACKHHEHRRCCARRAMKRGSSWSLQVRKKRSLCVQYLSMRLLPCFTCDYSWNLVAYPGVLYQAGQSALASSCALSCGALCRFWRNEFIRARASHRTASHWNQMAELYPAGETWKSELKT